MHGYFGYGANMSGRALRAKGVVSHRARVAEVPGWILRFELPSQLPSEGAFAGISPRPIGSEAPTVQGVLHELDDAGMEAMDRFEGAGLNYERRAVEVVVGGSREKAWAYVVKEPSTERCRPSRRYLNLLVDGAREHGIESNYIDWLGAHDVHPVVDPGPVQGAPDRWFTPTDIRMDGSLVAVNGLVFRLWGPEGFIHQILGGQEVSLLQLHRMDTSEGDETLEQVARGELTPDQRAHLDRMAHDLLTLGDLVGRYRFDDRQ